MYGRTKDWVIHLTFGRGYLCLEGQTSGFVSMNLSDRVTDQSKASIVCFFFGFVFAFWDFFCRGVGGSLEISLVFRNFFEAKHLYNYWYIIYNGFVANVWLVHKA